MSITATGFVFIILGLYGLVLNKKFLYEITIFFIPFSSTAVINVGSAENGSAIQPFMFLGLIWLTSIFVRKRKGFINSLEINKAELNSILLLLCFAFVTGLSLIMPVLINGKEMGNVSGDLYSSAPIIFSTRNITQYLYLLFGIAMAICLYIHNRDQDNYRRTLKVFSYSIIFVVSWGVLELFCYTINITYPSFIFNNSISRSAGGFETFLQSEEESTKRISSVAVEPSVLVQNIVMILPFLIVGVINKKYIFNRNFDIFLIISLYIFIIRTTSSLGIICLVLITLISTIYYYRKLNLKRKIISILCSIFIFPIFAIISYSLFQEIIDAAVFNKSDTYSSLERSSATLEAWSSFLNHPILGVGWGSVSSFDLFVKILSNTGIIGCFFFLGFLYTSFKNQIMARNISYKASTYMSSVIMSFSILIFANIVTGFSFVFGFFWLAISLMMVTGTNFYKKV